MPEDLSPDHRWQNFIGALEDDGPRPLTQADLIAETKRWPASSTAAPGVADLLATTANLWILAWYHYELLAVSATWSLLAVEASLRDKLNASDRDTFARLLKQAQAEGLLDEQWADRLDAGRQLRNQLAHARQQHAWTPGIAGGVVRTSHEAVSMLYATLDT